MTSDLELVRACAIRMGWTVRGLARKEVCYDVAECAIVSSNDQGGDTVWDPLHDDAQCFALVKHFQLYIIPWPDGTWNVHPPEGSNLVAHDADLNRAVVECIAALPHP